MPCRKQLGLKDFSPKSQDAVALQQIKAWRFTYDWSWWYPSGNRPLQQYLGFLPGAGYGQFEHKADSLIAKFQKRAERSERLMYEQSRRDYLAHQLSASSSACHGLLIITVITPLPTKPQRDKNARELKLANAAITDMQMRQRDAALDAKYTKELADAKAENDALRDDVAAGRRRLHIKAVCQSVREATTASGVDNAASRLADTAERDYFTLREADHYAKTTGRNPEVY